MMPSVTANRPEPDPARILGDLDALQSSLSDAQADLDQSERLAVLGTLAAMIAHEFRGIASKAAGNAQLIERYADEPERVRDLAARITRISLHAGRVAEAILAAADEPLPGDCLVLEIHRRALDALPSEARPRFDDSGIDPRLHAAIDPDALERVFANLYLNAWRAVGGSGGEGRVRVRASIERCAVFGQLPEQVAPPHQDHAPECSARNIVRIRVGDDGPGIHPEMAETLFEPFKRGTAGHGHGLGLALCRHLVASVGGSIHFDEASTGGAQVVIDLPLHTDAARRAA
jgi:signal transduction histidine kinase